MQSFGDKVIHFNENISIRSALPDGILLMNPFLQPAVMDISREFYNKYYNDSRKRIFLFGINPGRFGAGITGICFTDPIRLEQVCGITNNFQKKAELSSIFIFDMIRAYGGPEAFYSDYFITALSPLGFMKNGRNLNYYDDKDLLEVIEPFIVQSIEAQIEFGTTRKVAICIGEGENFKHFNRLNKKYSFYEEIIPLPHPRFIMQYRLKQKELFIKQYLDVLKHLKTAF